MLVTKDNYVVGARVALTLNAFNHPGGKSYVELAKSYNVDLNDIILDENIFDHYDDGLTTWCQALVSVPGESDRIRFSFCISEFSNNNRPGYYLKYVDVFSIEHTEKNLDILADKITKQKEFKL